MVEINNKVEVKLQPNALISECGGLRGYYK